MRRSMEEAANPEGDSGPWRFVPPPVEALDLECRSRGTLYDHYMGFSTCEQPVSVPEQGLECLPEPMLEHLPEPEQRPDPKMRLKYTLGLKTWRQWIAKNNESGRPSGHAHLFKKDILQLAPEELNYTLCLFIKEIRQSDGNKFPPDTIYYICLCIQYYLFKSGRTDDIFWDPYFQLFSDSLSVLCRRFSAQYNTDLPMVTHMEEEHLWESDQLGAYSPHVLLSTLMYFNTKYFKLANINEHMQVSFSNVLERWKRAPNTSTRTKVLRFYPRQSASDENRKEKFYEQQEDKQCPVRCPVNLYEFYLSKCPASVKTRRDVFYLRPKRSCTADSPEWYSAMPLSKGSLENLLYRIKVVKEIIVALY